MIHSINYYELKSDPTIKLDTVEDIKTYVTKNNLTGRCVFRKVEEIIINADPTDLDPRKTK